MKRLIVFEHAIGDNLLLTPSIRSLKKGEPETEIHILGIDLMPVYQVWENRPDITFHKSSFTYHPRFWDKDSYERIDGKIVDNEIRMLNEKHNFDKVDIITMQSKRNNHRIDRIAEELGVKIDSRDMEFTSTREAINKCNKFFAERKLVGIETIALHSGAGNPPKSWDIVEAQKLCDMFLERKQNVIVLDSEKEQEGRKLRGDNVFHITDMYERNLSITFEIIKRCKAFVGTDSAPMHLATITGKPVVGIFTMTWMHQTAPLTEKSRVVPSLIAVSICKPSFIQNNWDRMCLGNITNNPNKVEAQKVFESLQKLKVRL